MKVVVATGGFDPIHSDTLPILKQQQPWATSCWLD